MLGWFSVGLSRGMARRGAGRHWDPGLGSGLCPLSLRGWARVCCLWSFLSQAENSQDVASQNATRTGPEHHHLTTWTELGAGWLVSICSLLISGSAFSSEPGRIPFNFANICFTLILAQPSVGDLMMDNRPLSKHTRVTWRLRQNARSGERGPQGRGEELGRSWRAVW